MGCQLERGLLADAGGEGREHVEADLIRGRREDGDASEDDAELRDGVGVVAGAVLQADICGALAGAGGHDEGSAISGGHCQGPSMRDAGSGEGGSGGEEVSSVHWGIFNWDFVKDRKWMAREGGAP